MSNLIHLNNNFNNNVDKEFEIRKLTTSIDSFGLEDDEKRPSVQVAIEAEDDNNEKSAQDEEYLKEEGNTKLNYIKRSNKITEVYENNDRSDTDDSDNNNNDNDNEKVDINDNNNGDGDGDGIADDDVNDDSNDDSNDDDENEDDDSIFSDNSYYNEVDDYYDSDWDGFDGFTGYYLGCISDYEDYYY